MERTSSKDISLKYESEINLFAKKVKYYKGVVSLDDSVSISGNCPMIRKLETNNNPTVLGDFSGPYRLIKKRNNDTVKIVISYDTLYFKFLRLD